MGSAASVPEREFSRDEIDAVVTKAFESASPDSVEALEKLGWTKLSQLLEEALRISRSFYRLAAVRILTDFSRRARRCPAWLNMPARAPGLSQNSGLQLVLMETHPPMQWPTAETMAGGLQQQPQDSSSPGTDMPILADRHCEGCH